jgi:hypothetical protein
MEIDRITTRSVRIPQEHALVTSNIRIDAIWFLLVDLDTDEGVRAVREAIGSKVDLMVDFSSAFTLDYATRLAHALEPYGLFWIEDPIADEDVADHAEIARAVKMPICFAKRSMPPRAFRRSSRPGQPTC